MTSFSSPIQSILDPIYFLLPKHHQNPSYQFYLHKMFSHALRSNVAIKCLQRNAAFEGQCFLSHFDVLNSQNFSTNTIGTAEEETSPSSVQPAPGLEGQHLYNQRESLPVTFSDISRANVAIRTGVKRTTCEKSYFLSELIGANM
jgi:hypothetical protein